MYQSTMFPSCISHIRRHGCMSSSSSTILAVVVVAQIDENVQEALRRYLACGALRVFTCTPIPTRFPRCVMGDDPRPAVAMIRVSAWTHDAPRLGGYEAKAYGTVSRCFFHGRIIGKATSMKMTGTTTGVRMSKLSHLSVGVCQY
jgi:hypothetical protein